MAAGSYKCLRLELIEVINAMAEIIIMATLVSYTLYACFFLQCIIIIKLACSLKLIFNYLRRWGLLGWYNCMSLCCACTCANTMTIHNNNNRGYRLRLVSVIITLSRVITVVLPVNTEGQVKSTPRLRSHIILVLYRYMYTLEG